MKGSVTISAAAAALAVAAPLVAASPVASASPPPSQQSATTPFPSPSIFGSASVGRPLTAEANTWTRPTAYQWYRYDPSTNSHTKIHGATSPVYRPTAGDVGKRIKVRLQYGSGSGAVYKLSWMTSTVTPLSVSAGELLGPQGFIEVLRPGNLVYANISDWPLNSSVAYQWYRRDDSGKTYKIHGATSKTYKVSTYDVDYRLFVKEIGTASGSTKTVYSKNTVKVTAVAASGYRAVAPKIVGQVPPLSGSRLVADPGPMRHASSRSYTWYRVNKDDSLTLLSRGYSFTPSWKELAYPLQVNVSGYINGDKIIQSSDQTRVVMPGHNDVFVPTVFGSAAVGSTMRAEPGRVPSGVTPSYQWQRLTSLGTYQDISGATSSRYVPKSIDEGLRLRFKVSWPGLSSPRYSNLSYPVAYDQISFAVYGDSITEAGPGAAGTWESSYTVSDRSWANAIDKKPNAVLTEGYAHSGWLSWQIAPFGRPLGSDAAIALVGTNDVSRQYSTADILAQVDRLKARTGMPANRFIVVALPPHRRDPIGAIRYNNELRAHAKIKGYRFVPRPGELQNPDGTFVSGYSDDGLHPNYSGAQVLGDAIAEHLPSTHRAG